MYIYVTNFSFKFFIVKIVGFFYFLCVSISAWNVWKMSKKSFLCTWHDFFFLIFHTFFRRIPGNFFWQALWCLFVWCKVLHFEASLNVFFEKLFSISFSPLFIFFHFWLNMFNFCSQSSHPQFGGNDHYDLMGLSIVSHHLRHHLRHHLMPRNHELVHPRLWKRNHPDLNQPFQNFL